MSIKTFAAYLFLMTLTFEYELCTGKRFCRACNADGICTLCENSYWDLLNHVCVELVAAESQIDNCASYEKINNVVTCSACSERFFLKDNGKTCGSCGDNCIKCKKNATICTHFKKRPKNNSFIQFNPVFHLKNCRIYTISGENNSQLCSECESNFTL